MPRRSVLVLAALLAATAAAPSDAAPKPQLTDAKGDAKGGQAGTDILSATFATTGVGSGRKYVPKKFLVTMVMAGNVISEPGLTYEVHADTDICGEVTFSMQQGSPYTQVTGLNGWAHWGTCTIPGSDGPTSSQLLTAAVKGNTITWSFPIKSLPKDLELGTIFSEFEGRVDPANPAVPFASSTTRSELGLLDKANSATTWKLG